MSVLYPVRLSGKYGYIDELGNLIIEPKYSQASLFRCGLALVHIGTRCGFINQNGDEVVQIVCDIAHPFYENLGTAKFKGRWHCFSVLGESKFVIDVSFLDVFSLDRAAIAQGGKTDEYGGHFGGRWGYADENGQEVIPQKFDAADRYSEGLAAVQIANERGYIDRAGNFVIGPSENLKITQPFTEGLAAVASGDLRNLAWTYVNNTGKAHCVPQDCTWCDSFSEGMAAARIGKNWSGNIGYLTRNGNFAIQPKFSEGDKFVGGIATIKENSKCGYLQQNGTYLIEPHYDFAMRFVGNLAYVRENGAFKYINRNDRVIFSCV